MTLKDAARYLKKGVQSIQALLQEQRLSYAKAENHLYFGHDTARELFQLPFDPKTLVFQIVKGGTGKTALAYEFAIRASLYGAKVLCVDLDQQGNLTHAFNKNAENLPVMIDVLMEEYPIWDTLVPVQEGIHLLPSRFDNAMLDEVLRLKKLPLEGIYRDYFDAFKTEFDLIVVDCPPSLGQSVAACALAADCVIAPVTSEKFSLSGLEITYQSIEELENTFQLNIPLKIIMNKFDIHSSLSQEAFKRLQRDLRYQDKLCQSFIRLSQEFPIANSQNRSLFDIVRFTGAKEDIDGFTQEIFTLVSLITKSQAQPNPASLLSLSELSM